MADSCCWMEVPASLQSPMGTSNPMVLECIPHPTAFRFGDQPKQAGKTAAGRNAANGKKMATVCHAERQTTPLTVCVTRQPSSATLSQHMNRH